MKVFLFLVSTLFFLKPSFSQSISKDSVSREVKNAIDIYNRYNADNVPVYNGQQYLYYTFKMRGNPYFETGDFSNGWVTYDGRKYDSLLLIYDVERNDVVVLGPSKIYGIIMLNQFIDSFSLQGHKFISLQEDHRQNLYNTGFYDLLYKGSNVQLLERHTKDKVPTIEDFNVIIVFNTRNHFYIHKDGLYYLVSNKKDVFHVFADKERELKKMMRRNHLKLKKRNFETAVLKVTQFYDQLTH